LTLHSWQLTPAHLSPCRSYWQQRVQSIASKTGSSTKPIFAGRYHKEPEHEHQHTHRAADIRRITHCTQPGSAGAGRRGGRTGEIACCRRTGFKSTSGWFIASYAWWEHSTDG